MKLKPPKDRWNHGSTIDKYTGDVRFTSVSALELAARCLRRWKFSYGPDKLKDPETKSTIRGNEGHYGIEVYEKTGERGHLTPDIIAGLHQIPPPGPDLLVEQPLVPDLADGSSGLAFAKLRADNIPVVGKIDCVHGRVENYGVQDIRDARDEPGILKLIDWKFVGDLKNAKSDYELVGLLQMAGYAKWAFEVWQHLERVRITHGYFPLKGNPRTATALVCRDDVEKTWKRAEAIGVSIRHAAREYDINKIDANTRDCHSYGKPCPALVAGKCTAHELSSVADYVGVTAAQELLAAASLIRPRPFGEQQTMTQPQFPNQIPQQAPAANSIMAMVTGAPAPAAAMPDLASEMARLQGAITPAAPAAPAPLPPDLVALDQLLTQIDSYGMGRPTLVQESAKEYARLQTAKGVSGYDNPGLGYAGTGELSKYHIPTIAHLQQVLQSVAQHVAMRNQAAAPQAPQNVAQVTPPDAPQSTATPPVPAPITQVAAPAAPAALVDQAPPAALPTAPAGPSVEEMKAQEKAAKEAEKARKKAEKESAKRLAEEAAKAQAQIAAQIAAAQATQTVTNVVNVVNAPAVVDTAPPVAPTPVAPTAPPAAPLGEQAVVGQGTAINIYVDCSIEGLQTQSLWPVVHRVTEILTQQSGCQDFRDVPKENAFAYGRGEGAFVATMLAVQIPPGNYRLDSSFGTIGAMAVEAMRRIATRSGGVFVKGAR